MRVFMGLPFGELSGDDVRFDLVGLDRRRVEPWLMGLMRPAVPRHGRVAHGGERHGGPHGGVRVLAAVLPHARDVALDVARLQVGLVERRIEELDKPGVAADEAVVDGIHRGRASEAGSPAPESTDQLCGIESIWHSGFVAEPSGLPSSK